MDFEFDEFQEDDDFLDAALVEHLDRVEASHFGKTTTSTENQGPRWGYAGQKLHRPIQPQSCRSAMDKSTASLNECAVIHSTSRHPPASEPDHSAGIQRESCDAVSGITTSNDTQDKLPRNALSHRTLEGTFTICEDPHVNETNRPEEGHWVCSTCTLHNSASARWCEVCRAAAPTDDRGFKASASHTKQSTMRTFCKSHPQPRYPASTHPSIGALTFRPDSASMEPVRVVSAHLEPAHAPHRDQTRGEGRARAGAVVACDPGVDGVEDEDGLVKCSNTTPGISIDPEAARTFVYPAQVACRDYQYAMASTALFHNTLVVLPTGLGKTLIAAVVMFNFYRWFPKGKILFLAPTRPLVEQQAEACYQKMGIPHKDSVTITGSTKKDDDGKRGSIWNSKRIIYATPQTIANDLLNGICPAERIVCVVVDEAHRATGNYAYVEIVRQLADKGVIYRMLALSATPGSDMHKVQDVVHNLKIARIEFRGEDDASVRQYTHARDVQVMTVKCTDKLRGLNDLFRQLLSPIVATMVKAGLFYNKDPLVSSRYAYIQAKTKLQQDTPTHLYQAGALANVYRACEHGALLAQGYNLLNHYGLSMAFDYMYKRQDAGNSTLRALYEEPLMRDLMAMLRSSQKGSNHSPKLDKLVQVLSSHFQVQTDTRVIIFTTFRESVRDIVHVLKEKDPEIKVKEFIGQSSTKGPNKAQAGDAAKNKGQTQKEQAAVLEQFRRGQINTIVATSVGEEGLDIAEVDLIVCFDAMASPTRMIQRMGRTGRGRSGAVIVLAGEGKEENDYQKNQDKMRRLHHQLRNASGTFKLHPELNSRMVPGRYAPKCEMRHIAPPPAPTARGSARGHYATAWADAPLAAQQVSKLARYDLLEEHKAPAGVQDRGLSLIAFSHFQDAPTPVHKVEHSARAQTFIRTMRALLGDEVPGWVLPMSTGKSSKRRHTLPELFRKIQPQGSCLGSCRRPNPRVCSSSDEENNNQAQMSRATADAIEFDSIKVMDEEGRRHVHHSIHLCADAGASDFDTNNSMKGAIPAVHAVTSKLTRPRQSAKHREVLRKSDCGNSSHEVMEILKESEIDVEAGYTVGLGIAPSSAGCDAYADEFKDNVQHARGPTHQVPAFEHSRLLEESANTVTWDATGAIHIRPPPSVPFLHASPLKERQVIGSLQAPALIDAQGVAARHTTSELPAVFVTGTNITADSTNAGGPRDVSCSTSGVEIHPAKTCRGSVNVGATLIHQNVCTSDSTGRNSNNQIISASSERLGELGERVVPTSRCLLHAMSSQPPSTAAVPKTTAALDWAPTAPEEDHQLVWNKDAPLLTEVGTEHSYRRCSSSNDFEQQRQGTSSRHAQADTGTATAQAQVGVSSPSHQVAGCHRLQTIEMFECSVPTETQFAALASLKTCASSRRERCTHLEIRTQGFAPKSENQPNGNGLASRQFDVWSPKVLHFSNPCAGMREKQAADQVPWVLNKNDNVLQIGARTIDTSSTVKVACEARVPLYSNSFDLNTEQLPSSQKGVAAPEQETCQDQGFRDCSPTVSTDVDFPTSTRSCVGKSHSRVAQELQQNPQNQEQCEVTIVNTDIHEDYTPHTPSTTSIPNSPPDGCPKASAQDGMSLSPTHADGMTSPCSTRSHSSPGEADTETVTPTQLPPEQQDRHLRRTSVDAGPLVIPDTPGTSSKDVGMKTPMNILHQGQDARAVQISPRQNHNEYNNTALLPSTSSADPSCSVRHTTHAVSPTNPRQFQQCTSSDIASGMPLETPLARPHHTIPAGSPNTAEQMLDTQVPHTRDELDDIYCRYPSTPHHEGRSVVSETPYFMHARFPRTAVSSAVTPPNHQRADPVAYQPNVRCNPCDLKGPSEPDVIPESPMARIHTVGLRSAPKQSHSPYLRALNRDQYMSASMYNHLKEDSDDGSLAVCGAQPKVASDTAVTDLQYGIYDDERPHNLFAQPGTVNSQHLPPVENLQPVPGSIAAQHVVIPDTPSVDIGRASNTASPRAGDRNMHLRLVSTSNQKTDMWCARHSNTGASLEWAINAGSACIPPLHALDEVPRNDVLAATQHKPQTTPQPARRSIHPQPSMNSSTYKNEAKDTLDIDNNRDGKSLGVDKPHMELDIQGTPSPVGINTNEAPASKTSFNVFPTFEHGPRVCVNRHEEVPPMNPVVALEESVHHGDKLQCSSSVIPQLASRPTTSHIAPVTDLSRNTANRRLSRRPVVCTQSPSSIEPEKGVKEVCPPLLLSNLNGTHCTIERNTSRVPDDLFQTIDIDIFANECHPKLCDGMLSGDCVHAQGLSGCQTQQHDTASRQHELGQSITHQESDALQNSSTRALCIKFLDEDQAAKSSTWARIPSEAARQQKLERTPEHCKRVEMKSCVVEVPERMSFDQTAQDVDRTPSSGYNRSPLAENSCRGASEQSDGSEIMQRRFIRRRHQQAVLDSPAQTQPQPNAQLLSPLSASTSNDSTPMVAAPRRSHTATTWSPESVVKRLSLSSCHPSAARSFAPRDIVSDQDLNPKQPLKRLKRIQNKIDRSIMPPPPCTREKELVGTTTTSDNASKARLRRKRRVSVQNHMCTTPVSIRKRRCVARAFLDDEAGISESEEAESDEEDDLDTYNDGDGFIDDNTQSSPANTVNTSDQPSQSPINMQAVYMRSLLSQSPCVGRTPRGFKSGIVRRRKFAPSPSISEVSPFSDSAIFSEASPVACPQFGSQTHDENVPSTSQESDEHDDRCKICNEMGELLCCDECTSAVHLRCAGLQKIPEGVWLCMECQQTTDARAIPEKAMESTHCFKHPIDTDPPQKSTDSNSGFQFQTGMFARKDQRGPTEVVDHGTLHRDTGNKDQCFHPSPWPLKPTSTLRDANEDSNNDSNTSVPTSKWEHFQRLGFEPMGPTSDVQRLKERLAIQHGSVHPAESVVGNSGMRDNDSDESLDGFDFGIL